MSKIARKKKLSFLLAITAELHVEQRKAQKGAITLGPARVLADHTRVRSMGSNGPIERRVMFRTT